MAIRQLVLLRLLRDENTPMGLFESGSFSEDVKTALDPALSVERYSRRWRLSRPQEVDNRWLSGKLGFERAVETEAIHYDETVQDFVQEEAQAEQGTFSHYVIDLQNQYLLFELRPPAIQLNSFVGAFKKILDLTRERHRFEVEVITDTQEFYEWLTEVDEVEQVRVSLRRPNPSFEDRTENILGLLEETNAARIDVDAHAPEGESLQVPGTDLATMVDYAGEGYGEVNAIGKSNRTVRKFSSKSNTRSTSIEIVEDDDEPSLISKIIIALTSLIS